MLAVTGSPLTSVALANKFKLTVPSSFSLALLLTRVGAISILLTFNVTVATFELSVPSLTEYVNVSVPKKY